MNKIIKLRLKSRDPFLRLVRHSFFSLRFGFQLFNFIFSKKKAYDADATNACWDPSLGASANVSGSNVCSVNK